MRHLSRLSPFSSVRKLPRDLQFLFVSVFLWTFGYGLYTYVWSVYLRQLGARPEEVGLAASIGFASFAATMIPGGILANKFDLKKTIIVSSIVGIPTPLIFYFAHSWPEALVGLVLFDLTAFSLPAFNAYIIAASEGRNVSRAFALTYSAAPLGIVVSPALGGLLVQTIGIRGIFLFSFLFFTVSTLVLFPLAKRPPSKEDSESTFRLEIPRSSQELVLLTFITSVGIAYSIAYPFVPLYFQDVLGLLPVQIQLLGVAQSLGGATLAIVLGQKAETLGPGRVIGFGTLAVALGLSGIALAPSVAFVVLMLFLFGGARAPTYVSYSLLSSGEGRSRGGIFGFYLTVETLGMVLGSYLGGVLYTRQPAFVLGLPAAAFFLLTLLAWSKIGKQRKEGCQASKPKRA